MGKPSYQRRVGDNEAMAVLYDLRVSPRKLNLLAGLIRGRGVSAALAELTFNVRPMARNVRKLLQSAIANAENNHQLDVDRLYVKEATVGHSFALKRFHARARGRGASVYKPFSHLRIVVREREEQD